MRVNPPIPFLPSLERSCECPISEVRDRSDLRASHSTGNQSLVAKLAVVARRRDTTDILVRRIYVVHISLRSDGGVGLVKLRLVPVDLRRGELRALRCPRDRVRRDASVTSQTGYTGE